ncbi:hypothetical protein ACIRPQ_21530 [Streptomyces sp. NPDC101213]|uniref:hypothetical protein n=1 Tax=Streptomyces sp. NPDC101213 TaxID=3366130 RepID=UPI0037F12FAC
MSQAGLATVATAPAGLASGSSGRFFLVSYLPTYAGALSILWLVWAGAPGDTLSMRRAWRTAAGLGAGEIVLIAAGITVVAVVFQPLQLAMVRLLQGGWPDALGAGLCRARQRRRKARLERRTVLPPAMGDATPTEVTAAAVQRAGAAAARLRRRYPLPDHLVRPTALGNVLTAAFDTAGRDHGWDAAVAWPRLYLVLGDRSRAFVDDSRDSLDGAVRLAVTGGATALTAAVLLCSSGWWLALALIPLAVAHLAYHGAVQAAVAYGDVVHTAFDLHRFDLLRALHLPLPAGLDEERTRASALCASWRQGLPPPDTYEHPEVPPAV